ncbi:MAG TPA: hypothetical protein VLI06_16625, partial [Solimonas sp.]|nr:hypothetical protein [Solimonas sp.]
RASWNPVPGEPAIRQFNGMELARPRLEQAVDDLQRAIALLPEPRRHRLQLVQRLHELQRFDEAVAECDRVLATLAADDPLRDLVLELRGRSSGQGAGERHQMAALLEQSAQELPRGRRSMEDDFGNAMARNVAQRLRNGEDIGAAVLQLEDGDPDTVLAMSVADKLHACGNHPLSQFRPARAQDFARHMRRFAIRAQHELSALGFEGLGDYEPLHLSALLSEPTLLRCYRSQDGSICAASYSVRPLWPGWIAWLVLKLKGLYQQAAIIDLETRFSDGHFLVTTNTGGIDPLGTGPRVDTESMPLATPAAALFERHGLRRDVYLREHPGVRAVTMMDMDAVIETQDALIHAKNAWRRSVGYVTDAELQQLLGERQDLAGKVRAQLALFDRESPAAEAPAAESPAMSFPVISIARPGVDPEGTLGNLIQHALTQGIDQVRVVGSPLHSFYLDERGEAHFLLDLQGGADPMTMALEAIQSKTPGIRQCALVVDSRITLEDGKKRDAIVVMACERGGGNGQTWAQCYIPKGWFKPFREHGERQQIGEAKNFIAVALADR